MPKVTINGTEIEVDKGTTILRAAAEAGHEIPHFCYHPALSIPANCRMCLVEVEGAWKLTPSCYSQVTDGMVVHTKSERVIKAQKAVLEFILVNHPIDCPICDQAGECKLQDYYMAYDAQESRVRTEKTHKVKVFPIGPEVLYDGERCILCTRCVRFCEEITGTNELTIVQRGDRAEIRTFPGRDLDNAYSVCTADICPVGALTARDFRFKCRVWLLTSTDSICTGCSNGCNIHLEHFRNEIQRYRPRYNPEVNDYWMCDAGRLTYKEVHTDRLLRPSSNGAELTWHGAAGAVSDKLKRALDEVGKDKIGFVFSPQASCEDLFLARRFADEVLGGAKIYRGGKASGNSDDFLIKADKNPNTNGLNAVLSGASATSFDKLIGDIESGAIKVLYMMETEAPVDAATYARFVESLAKLDLFVLQSRHHGELAAQAHLALPAATHAEANGTFINEAGMAQSFEKAFEPHGDALPHWQIFMRLARSMGKPFGYTFIHQLQDEMFTAFEKASQKSESPSLAPDPA
jgi:NADH-quinone oxidoreductase subunit G